MHVRCFPSSNSFRVLFILIGLLVYPGGLALSAPAKGKCGVLKQNIKGEEFFKPEAEEALIEQEYSGYGKGLTPDAALPPAYLKKLSTKLVPARILLKYDKWSRECRTLFDKEVTPLLETHRELIDDPVLYQKIVRETFRNFTFIKLMARMGKGKVNDLVNIWFSISHPIYDLMFDDPRYYNTANWRLKDPIGPIIKGDKNAPAHSPLEVILKTIVERIDQHLPKHNREVFFSELYKLHLAQLDSISLREDVSRQWEDRFIRSNTFQRGGFSTRLYALLSDRTFSKKELESYYLFGAMLQNIDDISDIREDRSMGISTLAGRELITPMEIYQMSRKVRERFEQHVARDGYDMGSTKLYFDAIDYFIVDSYYKYQDALTHPLNPVSAPTSSPSKVKKAIVDYATQIFPFLNVF